MLVTQGYGSPGTPAFPSCLAFSALGVTPGLEYVDIVLSNDFTISGPAADVAYYSINPLDGGEPVTLLSLEVIANRLRIHTTDFTENKLYEVNLPFIGMVDIYYNPFQGPFSWEFTGVGEIPFLVFARSVDATTLDVFFSENVNNDDATTAANYSISPFLSVYSVVKITDSQYRLTTSRQEGGQVYDITVNNVRDDSGNPV